MQPQYSKLGFLLTLLLLCYNYSCQPLKLQKDDTAALFELMTGSFSSAEQAKYDSAYYDISLKMYPIWENRKSEYWLYVEQAVSATPDRPYRQRIYQLQKINNNLYESKVYTLPDEKRFVEKWTTPTYFNRISPDSLMLKEGCSVYLRKIADNYYRGATKEGTCPSSLRGAASATSEVEIFEGKIISWDRGFDKNGQQVWGATKGGYIFEKKTER